MTSLTVLELAQRLSRAPATVCRWVRSGKLAARKVGLQHRVEEGDLPGGAGAAFRPGWGRTVTGEPMPDVVALLRRSRTEH